MKISGPLMLKLLFVLFCSIGSMIRNHVVAGSLCPRTTFGQCPTILPLPTAPSKRPCLLPWPGYPYASLPSASLPPAQPPLPGADDDEEDEDHDDEGDDQAAVAAATPALPTTQAAQAVLEEELPRWLGDARKLIWENT